MRYLKYAVAFAGGLLVLGVVLVGGLIGYDVLFAGRSAADFANLAYSGPADEELHAYLARPDGPGPHPAVLLIHEWWGLNEDIVAKADALAREGYVVMAVDAWRGVSTRSAPRAILQVVTTPQERVGGDLDAAMAYLESAGFVDAGRIAVMGFCYGGGQSLQLATRRSDLAATILFYGQLPGDPNILARLRGPVLGVFGDQDPVIPTAAVRAFRNALEQRGIVAEITIYPGVGHAFANQVDAIAVPGPAMDAWNQTLRFLDEHVKPGA